MLLRVTTIPAEGIRMTERLDPAQLKELAALQAAGTYAFRGALAVSLRVSPASGLLNVEGRVEGAAITTCSRCLAEVEHPLESLFRLTFARATPGGEAVALAENRELKAQEMGLVPFEGDEIDLRGVIQEQVIMALPMQVHCREDCRGLCAGCGVNLNTEDCRCPRDDLDPRLAVLKTLKPDS